ncbi:glycosyl hydrolase family 28-related protein [Megasphaera elsdenii]|uniref:glycosyl hydrolase family 28-related protein n=1 Tax=Megasphaera elsdenii TaxID=907 RepID=UPI002A801A98|nr:glycosyl hydrolase family 28-related protein [Megasphaera elsdenii]MCI7199485.1 hypothetical protein [Megasphaera elsdenii]MDY4265653.1 glycosyl hydrolase family 28-related protein [Megasphaera elsdenii]
MIQTTEVSITYKGDGVQTSFPYPYPYRNSNDIVGYIINDVGYEKRITNNFKYDKVSNIYQYPLAGDPLAAPYSIKLIRETPQQQNADLPGKLPFSLIEKSLDWIIMILQEIGSRCNSLWHIRNDCKLSETNARNSASAAAESEENAADSENLAKKWAMSPVSPDGVADTDSPTGYTQSAKIWAALSKEYAGLSKLKLSIGYYNSVDEMRKSETAIAGRPCMTLGYYRPNDGGGAVYIIRSKKESDVDDGGSILVLDNGNVAELIVDGSINVKQFGAVGDGVTDDSEAIQNAINATPKTGGILYFPPGKYIQGDGTGLDYQPDDTTYSEPTNRDIRYIFDSYDHLTISGYGAVIEANINNPSTQKHAGLVFTNCTNILIQGLTYDGRLDKRPKTILSDDASWNKQHGIDIRDYNENITLMDVTCTRCMMDGFFIGGSYASKELKPTGIRMLNCISTYNYRQGLSVVSADNGEILNCQFSYTGVIKSTAPRAGIDFECDETTVERNNNWIVHNCKFLNNVGTGIDISLASNNIEVTSSYFYNNAMHINCGSTSSISAQFGNNLKISKNTFKIDAAPSHVNLESNSLAFYNAVDIEFFDNTFILYNNKLISIMDLAGSAHSISCLNIHNNKFINAGAIATCYIAITDPGIIEVIFDNNYIYNFCWVNGASIYTAISISAQKGRICNNNIYCDPGNNSSGLVFRGHDQASYSDMIITNNIISGYEKKVESTGAYADLGVRNAKLVTNNILSGTVVNMSGNIGWDTIPSAPSPSIIGTHKMDYKSSAPTSGTWVKGDLIFNSSPTGTILGWVCTASGTPGTWVPFGLIGNQYISSISSVPSFLGQIAIVSGVAYIATGTSSVTDWKRISN